MMTPAQRLLLGLYVGVLAVWVVRHLVLAVVLRRLPILTLRSPRFESPDPPLVSAIIPARDEAATLAGCLASVRAQTYPNLEVLVVDDRSTDGTGAIARAAEAADPRVRALAIDELPPGWTGKAHALHRASGRARGAWLWFLDADTRHAPDSLAIMMEYARSEGAALASLLPLLRCETFWERVVQPLGGVVLIQSFPLFLANRDRSRRAFANGQFILIRRDAYEAAGGHEAVRDRFVEDIALARRVKALGLGSRTAISTEISSTRMYTSLGQIVRGWARILWDAHDRRALPLVLRALDQLAFSQTAHVALAAAVVMLIAGVPGPFPAWLLGLSIAHHLMNLTALRRLYRLEVADVRAAAWYPLAGLVMDAILLRAISMCLTGRVTWRGTSYGPEPAAPEPSRATAAVADRTA